MLTNLYLVGYFYNTFIYVTIDLNKTTILNTVTVQHTNI